MKTKVLALVFGLATLSTFSQKNELKAAEKALKIKDYPTAITAISSAESLIANMDDKIKGKFYFLKAQAFYGKKDFQTAANAFENLFNFENETGKMRYTQMATTLQNQMVQEVYQLASDQYTAKDYKNASDSFYLTYQLSRADTIFVYNAAVSSSLAKDYDNSLKYYKELQDIGYTGISKIYYATNKQSDEKEDLGDEKNRDLQVKLGLYKDPVNELTESKTGDIIKKIAYILKTQGKTEEALAAIGEARKAYPNDINLILNEAEILIDLKEMDKFAQLMEEAISLHPNDPQLFFNLGVISFNEGKVEEAIKNYEKALELDPDFGIVYFNLALAILLEENALIEKMNVASSALDFDKYDELELKHKEMWKMALPYLIKADEFKRNNDSIRYLLRGYDILEMEEKADKLRIIYKQIKE